LSFMGPLSAYRLRTQLQTYSKASP
jgi:hypothetical protein